MQYCVAYVSLFENEMQMVTIEDTDECSALLRGIQYHLRVDSETDVSSSDPLTDVWLLGMLKSEWSTEMITEELFASDIIAGVLPLGGD